MSKQSALLARTATATLVEAAATLEAIGKHGKTPEQRLALAWTYDEIENRVGAITTAEEDKFVEILDKTNSYLAALTALRPQLANL
jgi:hypothetical protein